jgi:Toprim-like
MATLTLPGADIRGYYERLGIHLPAQARIEASVRCFADPAAHRREDRDPSCSVNLVSGAWKCHACGARGGAYDAAWRKGYSPRAAIDLMIAYGLTERRNRLQTARELLSASARPSEAASRSPARTRARKHAGERTTLHVTEQDVARWQTALSRLRRVLARLARERGWRYETIRALELGFDRGRITIPVRGARGELQGLLRYQPKPNGHPKMLFALGSRVGLIPHPTAEASERILLVEGPPDMIAARSRGLPAIAVPGDHAWQHWWARLLVGRQVMIVMDADSQGRAAADRIAEDLVGHAEAEIVELDHGRDDGYDLTDWLLVHPQLADEATGRLLLSCTCDLPKRDPAGMTSATDPRGPSNLDGSSG